MSHTRESVSADGLNKVATDRVPTCDFVVFCNKTTSIRTSVRRYSKLDGSTNRLTTRMGLRKVNGDTKA